jgi:hypothetical protein
VGAAPAGRGWPPRKALHPDPRSWATPIYRCGLFPAPLVDGVREIAGAVTDHQINRPRSSRSATTFRRCWLATPQDSGRWSKNDELRRDLGRLEKVARRRASGAETPPFGMCHSEFHPTSVHIGVSDRLTVMDWARAYTGSGLLDLVSWQGTTEPLNLTAVSELITAYVAAGGPQEAIANRGGLPAHVWASGWDKLWIVEWFLESTLRWGDPADDQRTIDAIRRRLAEAVQCLI